MWLSGFDQFTTIRPDLFQRPEVEPFGLPEIIRRQALTRPLVSVGRTIRECSPEQPLGSLSFLARIGR
jgi:hypothetical protein